MTLRILFITVATLLTLVMPALLNAGLALAAHDATTDEFETQVERTNAQILFKGAPAADYDAFAREYAQAKLFNNISEASEALNAILGEMLSNLRDIQRTQNEHPESHNETIRPAGNRISAEPPSRNLRLSNMAALALILKNSPEFHRPFPRPFTRLQSAWSEIPNGEKLIMGLIVSSTAPAVALILHLSARHDLPAGAQALIPFLALGFAITIDFLHELGALYHLGLRGTLARQYMDFFMAHGFLTSSLETRRDVVQIHDYLSQVAKTQCQWALGFSEPSSATTHAPLRVVTDLSSDKSTRKVDSTPTLLRGQPDARTHDNNVDLENDQDEDVPPVELSTRKSSTS